MLFYRQPPWIGHWREQKGQNWQIPVRTLGLYPSQAFLQTTHCQEDENKWLGKTHMTFKKVTRPPQLRVI